MPDCSSVVVVVVVLLDAVAAVEDCVASRGGGGGMVKFVVRDKTRVRDGIEAVCVIVRCA